MPNSHYFVTTNSNRNLDQFKLLAMRDHCLCFHTHPKTSSLCHTSTPDESRRQHAVVSWGAANKQLGFELNTTTRVISEKTVKCYESFRATAVCLQVPADSVDKMTHGCLRVPTFGRPSEFWEHEKIAFLSA